MPSNSVPQSRLLHYQIWLPPWHTALTASVTQLCADSQETLQKILSPWFCFLLNHSWFLGPSWTGFIVAEKKLFALVLLFCVCLFASLFICNYDSWLYSSILPGTTFSSHKMSDRVFDSLWNFTSLHCLFSTFLKLRLHDGLLISQHLIHFVV